MCSSDLIKKDLSESISNTLIDEFYERGMEFGASGGKLCGAGGGGFLLFFIKPEFTKQVIDSLANLPHERVSFSRSGAKVLEIFEK